MKEAFDLIISTYSVSRKEACASVSSQQILLKGVVGQ